MLFDEARELLEAGVPVGAVGQKLGFGWKPNFSRAFRQRFGCSPTDWLIENGIQESVAQRVARAERLLLSGSFKLVKAAKLVGFNSSQAMTMAFKAIHGVSASEWLRQNRKVTIETMTVPPIQRRKRIHR